MSVVIPGNVKKEEEEEDAEEVGHGEVHHCCKATDIVGWRTGGCGTATGSQGDRVGGVGHGSEEMHKGEGSGTEQETNTGDCYSG